MDAINCDNKDITPEEAFKRLIRKDDNDKPALNVVIAPAGDPNTEYLDCNTEQLSARDLFFRMITIDVDGNWALRVIETTES